VDEVYDNGEIIFQASCAVSSSDTPETVDRNFHCHVTLLFEKLLLKNGVLVNNRH
jgi:folate-dependent phosphoribosylglycinamide formyltransferase PurN